MNLVRDLQPLTGVRVPASALRAAAAERRLSKSKDNDDDDVYELPEDYSELSDILSSEDEPLQKGQGQGKGGVQREQSRNYL